MNRNQSYLPPVWHCFVANAPAIYNSGAITIGREGDECFGRRAAAVVTVSFAGVAQLAIPGQNNLVYTAGSPYSLALQGNLARKGLKIRFAPSSVSTCPSVGIHRTSSSANQRWRASHGSICAARKRAKTVCQRSCVMARRLAQRASTSEPRSLSLPEKSKTTGVLLVE